jgi:hypothetical protein
MKMSKEITFKGLTEKEVVVANELLFKLGEFEKQYIRQEEQAQLHLNEINAQIDFLQSSKKSDNINIVRYNEIKDNLLKSSQNAVVQVERGLKEAQRLLENIRALIKRLNGLIEIVEVDGKIEAHYNTEVYSVIVELMTNLGIIDYDSVIKQNKKTEKEN